MELPNLSESLLLKARQIQLLIMDVDGVLSDGMVYYTNNGDEIKNFNIKDGLGIKLMHQAGIKTAIITGRQSAIVERRAKELGISHIVQGAPDKRNAFQSILAAENLTADQVAHVGDDLPDLPLMQLAGLGIAVKDANWFVRQHADWITDESGGKGAVRNIAELLLTSREQLTDVYHSYLK
ncbi:3-deoxy-manno-octulosonate-8-phosphatase KdsC [Pleionea mediterranea]|jgi:3-deoxy-D-manno-octulosonate 8-phosphate phosphatase (KDO 8-P phosphatase)|uniref:3-deoxy-D-manno-octulosonate 8-phosphate phosphatase KdsC n=1 Tax=Pleionea mediterranea TaxID=523701 RepID=A0A316FG55_9GAMM|nr:3-deoxy-manno-octulosonate-8-phosphatase KdsC [Pleionea mediterranea]PWK47794.1 3-deoxy-D-manno-octulosonate 8-phosphate phosphatase (KDO 8-P phosphatase) [Pleionea mediterranea]